MTKICKKQELSYKALGAAMFMGAICLHMAIGVLFARVNGRGFYYHVPFALLVHGIVASMAVSAAFSLCISLAKSWGFVARYLLALLVLVALLAISILIPVINRVDGYHIWLISVAISTFAFGTAIAVYSNMHFKNTGLRSALIWEIS